jgi:hypothetical protein
MPSLRVISPAVMVDTGIVASHKKSPDTREGIQARRDISLILIEVDGLNIA